MDHEKTAAHKYAEKCLKELPEKPTDQIILHNQTREFVLTERIFRTAYKVAKLN